MDFKALERAKDTAANQAAATSVHQFPRLFAEEGSTQTSDDPYGFYEETLNTTKELQWAVNLLKSETLVDFEDEPEVIETREDNALPPKLKVVKIPEGQSYEDSVNEFASWSEVKENVKRQPNKVEHNCNLSIQSSDSVQMVSRPRKYQDAITIQNQTGSAGAIYVAEGQEKLLSNPIRGKKLNPGDQITYEMEAGLWMIAVTTAIVDTISTFYDFDDES